MKTADEIQRAHDLFSAIAQGEVPCPWQVDRKVLDGVLDTLCWVLGDEHGQSMANNLAEAAQFLQAAG